MKDIFVPYAGKIPAAVVINGHKLIILSTNKETMEDNLDLVGADHVECLKIVTSPDDQQGEINKLAQSIQGGVVVAPSGLDFQDLIKNLESELPWIH